MICGLTMIRFYLQSLEAQINLMPDESSKYELFDRVVNVREGYSVPLGLHGTVIGLILGLYL